MPREVFDGNGQSQPPEVDSSRIERFRSERDRDQRWFIPEEQFEALIASVNFPRLRELASSLTRRSGLSLEEINFLVSGDIYQFDNPFNLGCFIPEGNLICLNGDSLQKGTRLLKNAYGRELPTYEVLLRLRTLEVLIHEEIHALSYTRLDRWHEDVKISDPFRKDSGTSGGYEGKQSGYHSLIRTTDPKDARYPKKTSSFELFDEGVTEKIAQELFAKYLEEEDDIDISDIALYRRFLQIHGKEANPYAELIKLVESVVRKIAQSSGFDGTTVWQSIIRSKFEGLDLQDILLRHEIDAHVFKGFMEELVALNSRGDAIESCIQRVQSDSPPNANP